MSLLTTKALQTAPSASAGTTVTTGGVWTYGSWTQVIASAAADLTLAGFAYSSGVAVANTELEIDIGIGAAASEVSIGTLRVTLPGPTAGAPGVLMLPVPVSGITSGSRVSLRTRASVTTLSPVLVLLYYQSFDSDAILAAPACVPSGGSGVGVTPSSTAWANSAYTEITPGLGSEASLYGLTVTSVVASVDGEFDLATGGAGSETVIGTLRWSTLNASAGIVSFLPLSAVHPVAASTRLALRMRKSGTSTTVYTAALLYYAGTTFLAGVGATPTSYERVLRGVGRGVLRGAR